MAICEITPKRLKIIRLEVNLNNTNIALKKWEGYYVDGGKNEDSWRRFLRPDKRCEVLVSWDNAIGCLIPLICLKPS